MTPEEIKEIRNSLCVSQERFANLLGATVASVNRWENGKATPSRLYLKEIKQLKVTHGSYICRQQEFENTRRLCDISSECTSVTCDPTES